MKRICTFICLLVLSAGIAYEGPQIFSFVKAKQEEVRQKKEVETKWEKFPESEKEYIEGEYSGYNNLDDIQKQLYVRLNDCYKNMDESISVSEEEENSIQKVNEMILSDHPEYFWVIGTGHVYTMTTSYYALGEVKTRTYTPDYSVSKEEKNAQQQQIESIAQSWLNNVPSDANERDKVKFVYETVLNHATYEADSPDNQNIKSVFLNGKTVCSGYTKATQYLLSKLGIVSYAVRGKIEDENHIWNLVKVDGNWYWLDTTAGSQQYTILNKTFNYINYDYFLCSTEQLLSTHTIDENYKVPIVEHKY